jgi:uncharacterized ion transporter superfamily protein YfcC
VNYIRQYQINHGVAKAQSYNITLYIMAALLLVGLVCNLMVKPVAERFHMKSDPQRAPAPPVAVQVAHQAGTYAPTTNPAWVVLAWTLVGIPLLWGVYQTWLNAMKLFR